MQTQHHLLLIFQKIFDNSDRLHNVYLVQHFNPHNNAVANVLEFRLN